MNHTELSGSEEEDTFLSKRQVTSSEKEKFQPQAKAAGGKPISSEYSQPTNRHPLPGKSTHLRHIALKQVAVWRQLMDQTQPYTLHLETAPFAVSLKSQLDSLMTSSNTDR